VCSHNADSNTVIKAKFQKLHLHVIDLNLSSVVDYLFANNVIGADDMRHLHYMQDVTGKSRSLMALLQTTHHHKAFVNLRLAIKEEPAYSWLVEELDNLQLGTDEPDQPEPQQQPQLGNTFFVDLLQQIIILALIIFLYVLRTLEVAIFSFLSVMYF
jgi:hypothetical protein